VCKEEPGGTGLKLEDSIARFAVLVALIAMPARLAYARAILIYAL
jgi:hypothetical protein